MNIQDYFREEVKRLKWIEDISYKVIAEDLLEMKYHSFINWLHGYKNLSRAKIEKLRSFINDMK